MLSLATAQHLRSAGLSWKPAELDYFIIPLPDLENQVFVLTNMTVMLETFNARPNITFHGTTEWALDHIWVNDAIWIPREDQLREQIEERLLGQVDAAVALHTTTLGYRCDLTIGGEVHEFPGFDASEAYASALLFLLRRDS